MKVRDHSQHANTDVAENYDNGAPGTRQKLRPVFLKYPDGSIGRGWWEPFDADTLYAQHEAQEPLDPSEIVWPCPDYPLDEDGRGVAFLEFRQICELAALLCANEHAEHLTTATRIAA